MTKSEIVAALEEIGTLLELTGENEFRVKAYKNGARALEQLEGDFRKQVADGTLSKTRYIGEALEEKIITLCSTGSLKYLDELRASVPPGMLEMIKIPGLGPKKVKLLHTALQIDSIEKLRIACDRDEVSQIKGFGKASQTKIIEGIAYLDTIGKRVRMDLARALADVLIDQIRALPGVARAAVCGSIRRARETSKDIDILASSANAEPIMDAYVKFPQVLKVVNHGPTKSSIVAQMKVHGEEVVLNSDLRVVQDSEFPFALSYFTGSKEHNIRLRQRAIERELSLNEYALASESKSVPCKTEEDIYTALDLEYVPPELREDTGEIEAAEKHELPKLLEYHDIRGVFHNHTTASDGIASLETMAKKAQALGWQYFGVADHSQSLTVANGLSPDRVREQWKLIDELNSTFKNFRIFKGIESDILLDGRLDYDEEILKGFDYIVASVHSHFNLSEDEQTERICKALENPFTTMLGHATGRLLLRRPAYKLDIERVLQTAAKHNKMIEINAQPSRLDLEWTHVKRAKALGVKIVINPDAHSPGELALTEYGVSVARRGWLTKADVFNTLKLEDVMKALKK